MLKTHFKRVINNNCSNNLAHGAVITFEHRVQGYSRQQASLCLFLAAG